MKDRAKTGIFSEAQSFELVARWRRSKYGQKHEALRQNRDNSTFCFIAHNCLDHQRANSSCAWHWGGAQPESTTSSIRQQVFLMQCVCRSKQHRPTQAAITKNIEAINLRFLEVQSAALVPGLSPELVPPGHSMHSDLSSSVYVSGTHLAQLGEPGLATDPGTQAVQAIREASPL